MYRLFRDAARYKSGFSLGNPLQGEMPKLDPYYQKDLTYLNRDLSKVIMIDCDKRAFERQPENGLSLEKWDGSSNDTTLYDLAGLLRAIATSNVEDVRPVLQHYAATEKPIETFKMAQAKIQEDSRYAPKIVPSSSLLAGAGSTVSSFIRKRWSGLKSYTSHAANVLQNKLGARTWKMPNRTALLVAAWLNSA